MNRLLQTSFLLIASAVLTGGAVIAATPPKGDDSVSGPKDLGPGNPARAAGTTKRTIDPVRSGVSEAGWLDALRHVRVTELQAPLITKMVRTYLEQSRVWRQTMAVELDMVVAEIRRIRAAGGDIPPELSTRVRMIRGAMPRWNATQQLIISELTPVQLESLLLEIDRYKAMQLEKRKAENRRRATKNAKKVEPAEGVGRPVVVDSAAKGAEPVAPKPWTFIQSEVVTPTDPTEPVEPTESAEPADAPAKVDA